MITPTLSLRLVTSRIRETKGAVREKLIKVVHETALEAASIAYQLCPVDTGYLRSTIAIESGLAGMRVRLVVGAEYAGYVEYGTPFMSAQPYLRPAVRAVESRMNRRLGQIEAGLGFQTGVGRTRVQRSI